MAIQAVGAVVYRLTEQDQLEVLLIRKRGGSWTLPKGRLKSGEDPEAGLLREVAEETGLTGDVGELIARAEYRILKAGKMRRKIVSYYLLRATGGELRPDAGEGIEHVRWVSAPQVFQRIGRSRIRAVVRAALTHLSS